MPWNSSIQARSTCSAGQMGREGTRVWNMKYGASSSSHCTGSSTTPSSAARP
jgi:hypothetical protein